MSERGRLGMEVLLTNRSSPFSLEHEEDKDRRLVHFSFGQPGALATDSGANLRCSSMNPRLERA
jgi:hypothetical protein